MMTMRKRKRIAPEEGSGSVAESVSIGPLLADARRRKGWTLQELGRKSGVAIGTLSKIENGKSGASFDTVVRVARALEVSFEDILSPNGPKFASGRRAITRKGRGVKFGFNYYEYEIPCNDLVRKAMIPLQMTIKTRELMPRSKWQSHPGEEYIYVVSGAVDLHTEVYGPVRLEAGDSVYFDSMMAHALVNVGDGDAFMLSICLSASLDELFASNSDLRVERGAIIFDNGED
ncbi:helix-turn-helix domain-containing protein [Ancylobacter sp.]|uniref:helix-turn-helix domain-containing protein n=1 Tax=Ancylobacter sp. TaxID=1872567 RepID=UPI003C7DBACE